MWRNHLCDYVRCVGYWRDRGKTMNYLNYLRHNLCEAQKEYSKARKVLDKKRQIFEEFERLYKEYENDRKSRKQNIKDDVRSYNPQTKSGA
jgi:hypothetical protein